MADKCHACLPGLIILCSLLTGSSEAEVTHAFISSGENVHLPCNNALSDCTPTTWIYSRHLETVEVVTLGKIKKHSGMHERLSLGSDCSLNISKVTKEDYGLYSCRQYVNGKPRGTVAPVFLHVLHVSSTSSQTEIRPGRSVTLSCQLNLFYGVSCDDLVKHNKITLMWVNQAGVSLMTDTRYQIFSSSLCNVILTTTLLNEDHDREWICQLTQRKQLKTSAKFTVKYSEMFSPSTAVVAAIVVVVAVSLLIPAALWVICKRKANDRRTNDSVELKDNVNYIEVVFQNQAKKNKFQVDDNNVTYSSIRGGKAEQGNYNQLYASVNKKKVSQINQTVINNTKNA